MCSVSLNHLLENVEKRHALEMIFKVDLAKRKIRVARVFNKNIRSQLYKAFNLHCFVILFSDYCIKYVII